MAMVTIRDVAQRADVSISTVSRVINNPDAVSSEKRMRIQAIIREMGYTPNAAAREMVTGSTRLVGVLVSDICNYYITSVLASFNKQLESCGYSVFIGITDMDPQKEMRYVDLMLQKRVEMVTMFGVRRIDAAQDERVLRKLGDTPVIKVGPCFDPRFMSVATDEEQGAFIAVEHLIELGHRRIGFINGGLEYDSYYCKQMGFQKAMSKHNILVYGDSVLTVPGDFSSEEAYRLIYNMLKSDTRPTALLLPGDVWAFCVYRAASELGLRIPEDLSVIGYGNSPFSTLMLPSLTTIDQTPEELGVRLKDLLMEVVDGRVQNRDRVYSVDLLKRNSCAAPSDRQT